MRLLHISDLHFGKKLLEKDLLEDTAYAAGQIIKIAREQAVDAILIAGDIYDKSTPTAEAVEAVDAFFAALSELAEQGTETFIISGNHDSAARLSYCAGLFGRHGIHIVTRPTAEIAHFSLRDEYGAVNFYLLPFVKVSAVRNLLERQSTLENGGAGEQPAETQPSRIQTAAQAVEALLAGTPIDVSQRNVLLAHLFVSGAAVCDSEELFTGGSAAVPAALFDGFDYTALGHLHGPQRVGSDRIRYSGSPVRYSFSEINHNKSAALIELREKGDLSVSLIPITSLHGMRIIKGTLAELLSAPRSDDFIKAVLTDEIPPLNAAALLLEQYPNLLQIGVENSKTAAGELALEPEDDLPESQSVLELFFSFYQKQMNGALPDREQTALLKSLLEQEDGR